MNHHRIASGSPVATAPSALSAAGCGRRTFARHAVGLAALAALGACGGGGGSSADNGAASFFSSGPNVFSANLSTADSPFPVRVSLTLTPRDPLASSGSFVNSTSTVTITPITGLSDSHRLTGGYTGRSFTVFVESAASPIASTYDGQFTTDSGDTVRLTPTDGSGRPILTLTRNPPLS